MITRKPISITATTVGIIGLLITTATLTQAARSIAATPADHLVPPPLPVPQRLVHARAPSIKQLPVQTQPQLQQQTIPVHGQPSHHVEPPGFMTRIARWFGFGPDGSGGGATTGPREQQLTAESYKNVQYTQYPSGKQPYAYPKPQQQGDGKEPCTQCNKYPWVPMLPPSIQIPLSQQYQQVQQHWPQQQKQYLETQANQHYPQKQQLSIYPSLVNTVQQQQLQQQNGGPHKQRAVKFNFPSSNHILLQQSVQQSQRPQYPLAPPPAAAPFIPIPVPSLSASALPPLYNAQPFRPLGSTTEQQVPATDQTHFLENLGAHSELQVNQVIPTQIPPTISGSSHDASFEIIKSHQLTDFVSSVEYPATYVQSQAIDIVQQPIPSNHKAVTATEQANTVKYRHETLNPNYNKHIPGSQILTELGNFAQPQQQQDTTSTASVTNVEQTTFLYPPLTQQFETQSHVVGQSDVFYDSTISDNSAAASSHNFSSIQQENHIDSLPNWTAQVYPSRQTNEFFYTTPLSTETTETEVPTQSPQEIQNDFVTERIQDTTIEFTPSIQTEYSQQQQHIYAMLRPQRARGRETPKRLLDAPIHHAQGISNTPRPFTRDPSELGFRVMKPQEFQHANHAYSAEQSATSTWPVTPPPMQSVSSAAPTPTSTYGAIDASGHYAGMSPPAPAPVQQKKDPHQIVIPYTTKNRPRPFEPTNAGSQTTPLAHAYDTWSHSNELDPHEQQESKVVTTATNAPGRTTKYLTRILASNLRELLRREHEIKNKSKSSGFDFSKLQKNIDDWTEQEFTSLSHRPSTPTIRGRSKHIPTEYLTTTAATPRQSKTTKGFDVTSINNLEPLLRDRGSKRFEYVPIDDNRIPDYLESEMARRKTTTAAATTTTKMMTSAKPPMTSTSSSSTTTETTPFYLSTVTTTEEPFQIWDKTKILISPQTKEKVYVVTPQPRFFPQRALSTTTEVPLDNKASESEKIFKSPRFLVRPTPGSGTSIHTSTPSYYTPELFGLMGLSAYIPAEPVEIIDGNSKVITIVTPSNSEKNSNTTGKKVIGEMSHIQKFSNTPKPTMSPSPR